MSEKVVILQDKKVQKFIKDAANNEPQLKSLKQAIDEYLERLIKIYRIGGGSSTDDLIDCPECGHIRVIEYSSRNNGWKCLSCDYRISNELAPLDRNEFRELMDLKRKLEKLEKLEELLKKLEEFEKKRR